MKFQFTTLTLLFCLLTAAVYGQFTVRGTVVDTENQPLIGATVLIKGTAQGTTTDIDGSFSIDVPGSEAVLLFTYTGFSETEVTVTPATGDLSVTMQESVSALQEVVVVGYGETRREALTGSVTSLRSDKIEQVPLASIEQTLQGNIAGLQSITGNGQPGANTQIRIRGQGSISASSEPLYVIDGIPVSSGDLSRLNTTANVMASLNPNDIETVTVLKDAAATSIYGSRGANGVILITTKSGKSGKPKIDFRTQVGFNDWAVSEDRRLRTLTTPEYTEMYLEGWQNRGETLERAIERFNGHYPGAVDFGPNGEIQRVNVETNWIDEITRMGVNQSYDLSLSGGNDVVSYFASGSYFSQESPIIYSGMDRYSSRVNLTVRASDKLKFTNNLNVSKIEQFGASDGSAWANPMYNGYFLAPTIPLRDDQGRFYGDHQSFFMGGNNPVGSLSGDDTRELDQVRILNSFTGEYEITDGLKFKTAWAFDLINLGEFTYRNPRYGDGRNVGGFASESSINELNWIGTQTLNYVKTFAQKHNVAALVGYESQNNTRRRVLASGQGYPNPTLRTLASAAEPTNATSDETAYAFESIFSQVNYNYNLKYYLSGSVRRDGSSRFGINNRYGTFWSVGASWRLDQEDFISSISAIDALKLRSSYGTTGNAGIGNFAWVPLFGFGADYDGSPGGRPSNVGNIDLTWERTTSFNVGLDFGLFNMLSGTVEYFNRESDNLLLDRPISATTGFTSLTQNFGAMRNSGWEITLDAAILSSGDFQWNVGGNITFLKNEITRLDEDIVAGTKIRREGFDYQSYYLFEYAGVDAQTGLPQWYTDETENTITSNIAEASRFISGRSATPDFFGGFNTNMSWKGIVLDAQFSYSWGNYVYDSNARFLQGDGALTPRSQTNLVLNRWRQPGDMTDVPQFQWGNRSNSNVANMTRWLYDGSFIRLRNLTLAYNLPSTFINKANLRSARVYFRGTNVLTFFNDPDLYLDPEAQVSGVISSPIPNMRTFSFGLDLGF